MLLGIVVGDITQVLYKIHCEEQLEKLLEFLQCGASWQLNTWRQPGWLDVGEGGGFDWASGSVDITPRAKTNKKTNNKQNYRNCSMQT